MVDGSVRKGFGQMLGVLFLAPFVLVGLFGPELGLWLAQDDEPFIVDFLRKTLHAQIVDANEIAGDA
jgi:hypothetical protein